MSSLDSQNLTFQDEEGFLTSSKFETYDELLKGVRAFYFNKGYGLSVRDSKKDKYVILQCDRGGLYRDTRNIGDKRKKSTVTRLIDCPFLIAGNKQSDGFWVMKAKHLQHNHVPSSDISGHPSFRRLPSDDVQTVKNMTLSGIPPRQILSSLRQQTQNLPAISRTIYNLKAKIRKDDLGNRSMISALFEELGEGGFSYDVLHDSEGRITRLFIAHPKSIKLAKTFSNIFVMDCTYKTNRYKMPLLDIIGISCFNTTFYSGFAFLEKEDEDNYLWALHAFKAILGNGNQPSVIMTDRELALINGIKNVFPSAVCLLCVWHIEKNVVANCKKYFKQGAEFDIFMSSWNNVVFSATESLFECNWSGFELFYQQKKDAIEYIKKVWLPWKEKFVSAWTENYLHLGTRTSSRVEGAHAKLKLYLQVSKGGFQEVKNKICLAIEHEFNEIKVKLASEKIQVLHDCNMPVFRDLMYRVSHFALKLIHTQFEKTKDGTLAPCTGQFMATMGLPCAHMIKSRKGMIISMDLIHPQWRIDTLSLNSEDNLDNDGENKLDELIDALRSKYKVWPLHKKERATSMLTNLVNENDTLFEPVVRRPKGRPPKSKKKRGINSTTRDPSRFEIVESSQAHNPSSSTCIFQTNIGVAEENMHQENSSLDLNAYPEF